MPRMMRRARYDFPPFLSMRMKRGARPPPQTSTAGSGAVDLPLSSLHLDHQVLASLGEVLGLGLAARLPDQARHCFLALFLAQHGVEARLAEALDALELSLVLLVILIPPLGLCETLQLLHLLELPRQRVVVRLLVQDGHLAREYVTSDPAHTGEIHGIQLGY